MIRGLALPLVGLAAGAAWAEPAVHHDLTVVLEPESRAVEVTDRMRVRGPARGVLRLPDGFSMGGMRLGGGGTRLTQRGGAWRIDFSGAGEHRATLGYHGTLAPLDAARDDPAAGVGRAGQDGAYLPAGGGWHVDLGAAPFTYALEIDVPAGYRAVAPGRLAGEETADGRYRARFVAEAPGREVAVLAGPYRVDERTHGAIALRTYFHPRIADLAPGYLDAVAGYLDRYAASIGDYPYAAFSVVSAPLPVGLSLPGLTYMGTRVLRLPFIRATSLGHEVLHSWWGNGVRVDPGSGNWSEGLTTFMADYAYAEDDGAEAARAMREGWLRDFAALPADRAAPLADFTAKHDEAAEVVGYGKAAMVFVMLRDEIGRAAFDAGVRAFWRDHRLARAGWDDLRRAFEAASETNLSDFFAQWLERPGAPWIALRNASASAAGDAHRVSFTLIQDAPAYALRLPVAIETDAGVVERRVFLDDRIERYTVTVDAAPQAVEVDPDARVFRRLDPAEAPPILRHAALAPAAAVAVAGLDRPDAAMAVAERLVAGDVRRVDLGRNVPGSVVVVVGLSEAVAALLAEVGLPAAPERVRGRGDARAWTARRADGTPLVVVEADDAAAFETLAAKLPHYGGESFVVFEAGRAVDRGVWPPAARPLRAALR